MNFKTGFIALAIIGLGAASMVGCGGNACDDLADKFAACADGSATTDGGTADCTDAQLACAQCFLDSGKDVCTELLDIAADCVDSCS
jgi:hypothetical protein